MLDPDIGMHVLSSLFSDDSWIETSAEFISTKIIVTRVACDESIKMVSRGARAPSRQS